MSNQTYSNVYHLQRDNIGFVLNLRNEVNENNSSPNKVVIDKFDIIPKDNGCRNRQCVKRTEEFQEQVTERRELLNKIQSLSETIARDETFINDQTVEQSNLIAKELALQRTLDSLDKNVIKLTQKLTELNQVTSQLQEEITRATERKKYALRAQEIASGRLDPSMMNISQNRPQSPMKHNGIYTMVTSGRLQWSCCLSYDADAPGCIDDDSIDERSLLAVNKGPLHNYYDSKQPDIVREPQPETAFGKSLRSALPSIADQLPSNSYSQVLRLNQSHSKSTASAHRAGNNDSPNSYEKPWRTNSVLFKNQMVNHQSINESKNAFHTNHLHLFNRKTSTTALAGADSAGAIYSNKSFNNQQPILKIQHPKENSDSSVNAVSAYPTRRPKSAAAMMTSTTANNSNKMNKITTLNNSMTEHSILHPNKLHGPSISPYIFMDGAFGSRGLVHNQQQSTIRPQSSYHPGGRPQGNEQNVVAQHAVGKVRQDNNAKMSSRNRPMTSPAGFELYIKNY